MTSPEHMLYRTLDTVGDGSGTTNSNVDGSGTPVDFKIVCPGGERYFLTRMMFALTDTSAGVVSTNYGGLSALSNGLDIGVFGDDDVLISSLLGGLPLKTNTDWLRVCFDFESFDFGSNIGLGARWTFTKDFGRPIVLETGQYLAVTVNDDLEGLLTHYFSIRGYSSET